MGRTCLQEFIEIGIINGYYRERRNKEKLKLIQNAIYSENILAFRT